MAQKKQSKWEQRRLAEIIAAREQGLGWTEYREFLDPEEMIGAALCPGARTGGKHPRRIRACTRRAQLVSYSTVIGGRVVICKACHNWRNEFKPVKHTVAQAEEAS